MNNTDFLGDDNMIQEQDEMNNDSKDHDRNTPNANMIYFPTVRRDE